MAGTYVSKCRWEWEYMPVLLSLSGRYLLFLHDEHVNEGGRALQSIAMQRKDPRRPSLEPLLLLLLLRDIPSPLHKDES